jgi:hypothetical protein
VRNNQVIRNGVELPSTGLGTKPYLDDTCRELQVPAFLEDGYVILKGANPSPLAYTAEISVPPGKVYVIGGNRDRSADSRQWRLYPWKMSFAWPAKSGCHPARANPAA